jgi:hypothetical protein
MHFTQSRQGAKERKEQNSKEFMLFFFASALRLGVFA